MNKDLKGYAGICLVGILMSIGVSVKYREDIKSARRSYMNEIEAYEYDLLTKQLAWMKTYFPLEHDGMVPAG